MNHFSRGSATLQDGMRKHSFRRRLAFPAAIITASIALTWATPGTSLATPCSNPYNTHYKAQATSGHGTNTGTGAWMDTWSSWSFDGHSQGNEPFSNEAVWTINYNNRNNAIEVGFNVGTGANEGIYENYMYPYWTQNNGQNEHDYTATMLPTNSTIWNSATSNGTNSWAYVNNTLLKEISYGVATPRWNYEQAEVNYHDIWMGGGSGSGMTLSYQSGSNGQWYTWGDISGSTWWYELSSPYDYGSPAGYGYNISVAQPATANEGGYGQAC